MQVSSKKEAPSTSEIGRTRRNIFTFILLHVEAEVSNVTDVTFPDQNSLYVLILIYRYISFHFDMI